jgi:cell division protein FtsX
MPCCLELESSFGGFRNGNTFGLALIVAVAVALALALLFELCLLRIRSKWKAQ